jgi:VanZ family protein
VTIAVGIFAASSIPGRHMPPSRIPHLDKIQHGIAYLLLGAACARGLALSGVVRPAIVALAGAGMALGYGASDELHQAFVPGRSPELADLAADGLGALIGAGLCARVRRRLPAKQPS